MLRSRSVGDFEAGEDYQGSWVQVHLEDWVFVKDALIWVEVVGKIELQEENVRFVYVVQDSERETNRNLQFEGSGEIKQEGEYAKGAVGCLETG